MCVCIVFNRLLRVFVSRNLLLQSMFRVLCMPGDRSARSGESRVNLVNDTVVSCNLGLSSWSGRSGVWLRSGSLGTVILISSLH